MLSIGYLIICEEVIPEKDQIIIRKPLAALTPLNIPGNFSFKVAFSLHNLDKKDFGEENKVRVIFKDPNGNNVIDTGELQMRTNPDGRPDNATVEIAEADLSINNVDLYHKGIYTLILCVNDESKELKVPVIERLKQNG